MWLTDAQSILPLNFCLEMALILRNRLCAVNLRIPLHASRIPLNVTFLIVRA